MKVMKYSKKDIKKGFKFINTQGNVVTVLKKSFPGSDWWDLQSSTGKKYDANIGNIVNNLNNGIYGTMDELFKEEVYEIY